MNVESSVEQKCICEPRKYEQLLKDDSSNVETWDGFEAMTI